MDTNSTFIFMAADNHLDLSANWEIDEILQAELAADVKVVLQFDRRQPLLWEAAASAQRLQLVGHQLELLQDMGQTNAGDPAVLNDFLQWGSHHFPAQRKIAIICNHDDADNDSELYLSLGSKFKKTLFCPKQQRRQVQPTPQIQGVLFQERQAFLERQEIQALAPEAFHSALPAHRPASHADYLTHIDRLVCIGDTSRDFLDNLELKSSLALAQQKFDLVIFDACMMSRFEIVYQLRDEVEIIIASEEMVPNMKPNQKPTALWPYRAILNYLSANQTIDNETLAREMVRLYGEHHAKNDDMVTQSALRTENIAACAAKLDAFAALLTAALGNIRPTLADILAVTRRFSEGDYIDIYDFVLLCKNNVKLFYIPDQAEDLLMLLDQSIIANVATGHGNSHAHGLAIYFPQKPPKDDALQIYRMLDFTMAHPNWLNLINAFYTPPVLRR